VNLVAVHESNPLLRKITGPKTSGPYCVNFTGFPFVSVLSTNWRWRSTSASMDWRLRTWLLTVCPWRLCQADDISDLMSPAASLSPGQWPLWAVGTLQSLEPKYGTVYLSTYDSSLGHCVHSDINWNIICLWVRHERIWGLLRSRYINFLIIIITYLSVRFRQKQICPNCADLPSLFPDSSGSQSQSVYKDTQVCRRRLFILGRLPGHNLQEVSTWH